MRVTNRTYRGHAFELVPPRSKEGETPSDTENLPDYGPDGRGAEIAVGCVKYHTIYRYSYDDKRQKGSWNYHYTENDGVLA